MKKRWIAGLLAVSMTVTVLLGSLPAMAAQGDEAAEWGGTASEQLAVRLADEMTSYAEETLQNVESPEESQTPEEEPELPDEEEETSVRETEFDDGDISVYAADGTTTDVSGYEFEYAGNTLVANLCTDTAGNKVATITKVKTAGTGVTACNFPDEIDYQGSDDEPGTTYRVTKIHFSGFGGVPYQNSFESIRFPENVEEIYFGYDTGRLKYVKALTIPGSVQCFTSSLQNMTALETLTFEEGVEEISSNSMISNCSSLTTINLPDSLQKLSKPGTFSGATKLKTIALPEGIQINEGSTFSGCVSLQEIDLPDTVTKIGSQMFSGCTALTTVRAKATITEVESKAFNGCKVLKDIPDLGNVAKIGQYAFQECDALETVDLHSLTSLGYGAFYSCDSLSGELDLSGVDVIPGKAFAYDSKITSVKTSKTLKSIGTWAFIWADIQNIELPETLTSIGTWAFYDSSLSGTLKLPDSLTSLGDNAFKKCTGIEEVEIGSGLTEVPTNTFTDCTSLKKITVNNSSNNITIPEMEGVTVEYRIPSLTADDDKISDKADALTLQQAVNQAAVDGQPVKLEKDIKLSAPVTVPDGNQVEITADQEYTIFGDGTIKNLFEVSENSSDKGGLLLNGNVILGGWGNTGSVIVNHGSLTMDGNSVIEKSILTNLSTGVVENTGEKAEFVLRSGTIQNNKIRGNVSGSVRVTKGAHFIMEGGTIQENIADDSSSSSPAVLLLGDSYFEMNGGTICGNRGQNGTAVYLTGSGENSKAHFTLNSGTLRDNVSERYVSESTPTGAVFVKYSAEFLMYGGEITGNTTQGNGAGVAVADELPTQEHGTTFKMYGGTISGNQAKGSGQPSGGGIYSFSNQVYLYGGLIQDNQAYQGGGIYSEGNTSVYTTLHMENALITGNTASQGGGLWFCPTGDAKLYTTNGAVIYGNTASDAGDDFASPKATNENNSVTLADYLPNGKVIYWYRDGRISASGLGNNGTHGEGPRYDADTNEERVSGIRDYEDGLALKAIIRDEDLGMLTGALVITGNTATHGGGGIGANGGIVIGEDTGTTYQMTVSKVWENEGYPQAQPDQVTVCLKEKYTGDVVDTAELNEANNWQYTFTGLPMNPEQYTAEEEPVEDYDAAYSQDADGNMVITNTLRTKSVSVSKVWADDVPEFRPVSVEVELMAVDRAGRIQVDPEIATLSEENGWSWVFTGLPACRTYLVMEKTRVAGYQTTITGDDETGFIITNTAQPTPVVTPEDPPVSFDIEKKWVDDREAERPSEIHVTLWNGIAKVSSVTLTAENGWKYTFTLLPAGNYSVTEEEVEGYKTDIQKDEEGNFIITNTWIPDEPDTPVTPPTPDEPDTPVTPPTPDEPDTPVTPPTPDEPDTPVTPPTPDEPGTPASDIPSDPIWYDPGIPVVPLDPEEPPEEVPAEPSAPEEIPPVEIMEEPEGTPPAEDVQVPSSSEETSERIQKEPPAARKLIQTGQNWWVVWILVATGGSMILFGFRKRSKGKHEA